MTLFVGASVLFCNLCWLKVPKAVVVKVERGVALVFRNAVAAAKVGAVLIFVVLMPSLGSPGYRR